MKREQRKRSLAAARTAVAVGLVLAASAATAWAQGEATVRGRIVAAADGSALRGVDVTLASVRSGSMTTVAADAEGAFAFQDLRPGEYVLSSAPPGFTSRELRLVLKPREVRIVDLSFDLRRVEVAVDVTARARPSPSTYSPSSTVLAAERVENMPRPQQMSLTDAIVTVAPGMIRGHDDFVHVRGHEVALNPFVNGVSLWENPHAVFSAGLSPEVIDTANIMTGAFPAEYGNRFGGVVDIVTKSGLTMQNRGSAAFGGSEAGRYNLSGDFGGRRRQFGYYLFGSWFESDRFLSPPEPKAIHDSARGGRLFVQIDRRFERAGQIRAVFGGDATNFDIPMTEQDVVLRPLSAASQRTRQQTAIVSWMRASSQTAVDASFYQRWSSARLLPGSDLLAAAADVSRELLTIGGRANVTRFTGRHAIKGGVDAAALDPDEALYYDYAGYRRYSHLAGLPHIHFTGPVDFTGHESGGQAGAYVQDTIQLGSRVTADVGLRVDHHSLVVSTTHASPRVNLAVGLGQAVLHASYNRFFVPPPVEGVLSNDAGLTAYIREIGVALPPIEPTTEDQFELGVAAPAGPLSLALTGYYRTTDNPVHTTVWPDSRIYSYASFDRERAYGLEAKAGFPMLTQYGLTGYLNYALSRVDFYNPVTGGFVTEAEHLSESSSFLAPMDQTHTLTAGATYRHASSGVWIGTTMEYGSGTPMGHDGAAHSDGHGEEDDHGDAGGMGATLRVPQHFTANLSIGVDLFRGRERRGRLSLQLDIENLTDNAYLVAQEGEFAAGQYYVPRLVGGSIRVRF